MGPLVKAYEGTNFASVGSCFILNGPHTSLALRKAFSHNTPAPATTVCGALPASRSPHGNALASLLQRPAVLVTAPCVVAAHASWTVRADTGGTFTCASSRWEPCRVQQALGARVPMSKRGSRTRAGHTLALLLGTVLSSPPGRWSGRKACLVSSSAHASPWVNAMSVLSCFLFRAILQVRLVFQKKLILSHQREESITDTHILKL